MGCFGGAAHRVAVPVAHPVPLIHEIEMRVDLQDVDVLLIIEGADAGDVDRMIAADHHRQGRHREGRAHARLDVGVAGLRVGMDDVRIAHVDDVHVTGQIGRVVLVIIGPGVAEAEQGGRLAHPARAKARAAAVLRARIEWCAKDRHIRIEPLPVGLIGPFAEGRDPHEWQIQPAAFIAMSRHLIPLFLGSLGQGPHDCKSTPLGPFQSGRSVK